MRSAPLLLLGLVGATGLALGLAVMLRHPVLAVLPEPPRGDQGQQGVETRNDLPQGHIYAGLTEEPDCVNPYTAHGAVARRFVLGLTHEGLLDIDPVTAQLRPALASSFATAPDGMSCTFTLRQGVLFADGSPMTMPDVLFGWELAQNEHVQLGHLGVAFASVQTATALDDHHLRITFKDRHYAATRVVGEAWLVGKRQFFVDRIAARAAQNGQPAPSPSSPEFAALLQQIDRECGPGTGPYMLPSDADGPTTWQRRQQLLLVRNPHCWRRAAMPGTWNLAGMRLLFRDGASRFNSLVNREIDWYGGGAPIEPILAAHPELANDYAKVTYDYATLGVLAVVWNCRRKPLDDARVRRALAMLVDQSAILEKFEHQATAARALAKPDSPEYPTGTAVLPFDPRQARQLLREAGFGAELGKRLRLEILGMQGPSAIESSLDLLVDAGKQAGVEIAVHSLEFSAYVAAKDRLDWDGLMVNRSFLPWGDPYDFVHRAGLDNEGGFAHADVDRLAAAARVELDAVIRAATLRELHELVYREQPMAFFVHPRVAVLFNRHIENAVPGPLGLWPERFWVAPQFQRTH